MKRERKKSTERRSAKEVGEGGVQSGKGRTS